MQPLDDHPNDEEKKEKLDQDFDPPYSSPPDENNARGQRRFANDDPRLDEVESTGAYQEGEEAEADPGNDAEEPPHGYRVA
jgi:hypothetical protein